MPWISPTASKGQQQQGPGDHSLPSTALVSGLALAGAHPVGQSKEGGQKPPTWGPHPGQKRASGWLCLGQPEAVARQLWLFETPWCSNFKITFIGFVWFYLLTCLQGEWSSIVKYHSHRWKEKALVTVIIKSESLPVPSGEEFLLMYSLENELGIHPVSSMGKRKYFLSELGMMKICLGRKIILSYNCNTNFIFSSSFILFRARNSF